MSVQGKQKLRQQMWDRLEEASVARFPGAQGRIPNFVGAEEAARRLAALPVWQAAQLDPPFWFVNLVRQGEEITIERDFGRFLRQDKRHQFRRAEWQELLEALCPLQTNQI